MTRPKCNVPWHWNTGPLSVRCDPLTTTEERESDRMNERTDRDEAVARMKHSHPDVSDVCQVDDL